jgi:hypothetical protein
VAQPESEATAFYFLGILIESRRDAEVDGWAPGVLAFGA